MANSDDPDEMPHNAAFHQGQHCLVRQNPTSGKEYYIFLEIITCVPSIYVMDHPDLSVSIFMEKSIALKWVKIFQTYQNKQ